MAPLLPTSSRNNNIPRKSLSRNFRLVYVLPYRWAQILSLLGIILMGSVMCEENGEYIL